MKTTNLTLALALRVIGIPVSFENKGGWKLDADGKIEIRDGNPVYVDEAGQEVTLGTDTVKRLNAEAKANRVRAEAAEAKLEPFKDIDPAKAREALDTVRDLSAGDLMKKGEVDKVREEINKASQKEKDELARERDELRNEVDTMHLSTSFKGSKFITDNIAVPSDLLQAQFGRNFKRENGQLVGYYPNGEKIYSATRGGELATFDEAMKTLVDQYTHKDQILKGTNNGGTGGNGGGGTQGGKRIVRRADFDVMTPSMQAQTAQQQNKGELTIAD